MDFFILAAILLLLIPSKPVKFNPEYLSMKQTNIIRGFFLLLVFMIHFCQYIQMNGPADRIFQFWRTHSGQLVVTLFLLYSGYGVFVSIMKKGAPYIRRIPIHRALRTLVHFDMAVLLYLAAYSFMGRTFSPSKILLAFTGWESLGNSNWYIFIMLLLYLITWITFRIFKDKPVPSLLFITVLTVMSMYILSLYKTDYWYSTMLCYPAGMWYGLFKEKIDAKLKATKNYIFAALILMLLLLVVYKTRAQISMYAIGAVVFALVVVLFTMKLQLGNPLLEFTGKNLFGLYIMQRLPMAVLQNTVVGENAYVYAVVCFLLMYLVGIGFGWVCEMLDEKVLGRIFSKVSL